MQQQTQLLGGQGRKGGQPECCHTSIVLKSTFRYVKFVKRLRAQEEEQRKGAENLLKTLKDQQNSDFFIRCDRRSLINNVARRVDLCMASYEQDIAQKRTRLIALFKVEEEANLRKFVEQAQAGAEAIWQDKQERLKYLLAKRKKEHEEKYKDTPLSKCVHILPCIYKLRANETEKIQLYQIMEKEHRKMAEKEFDKMWYEVAMSESEALKARMEQDAIERFRKDLECKQHSDRQLEYNVIKKEKEREILKEESKRFKAIWEADLRKEREGELKIMQKSKDTARERKEMMKDRQEIVKKLDGEAKLIADTWDSLAGQGLADEKAKILLAKKKEGENDECNRQLIKLKTTAANLNAASDAIADAEAAKFQQTIDERRCAILKLQQNASREVRQAMINQIKDRQASREVLKQKMMEQDKYDELLKTQVDQLISLKERDDAEKRKQHQRNLVAQIEYNNTLKERARQEELDQLKKCKIATEEYQQEIERMMCRPFFSEEIHPFMKQMAKGLKMKEKCPCSRIDYCAS